MRILINKYRRHIAFFFLINFVSQVFMPTVSLALTSGPSQPEVESFKPIDVADMVNNFTGDFSYNIPLLDVDGYPVNISYGGGSGMDQEATCVGLGWNINTGSISRGLRGIPDDFNGAEDEVTKEFNIKDNETYGVTLGVGAELAGTDALKINYSIGVTYNNYVGYNVTQKVGFSVSLGDNATVGLGVGSSGDGLTLSPSISLSAKSEEKDGSSVNGSVSLGTSFNSRTGMKALTLSASVSQSKKEKGTNGNKDKSHSQSIASNSSEIGFGSPTWVPQITMPMKTKSLFGSFKIGGVLTIGEVSGDIAANYSKQSLATKIVSSPAYGYLNLQNGQGSDNAMLDFNREKDANFSAATTNLPIPNLTYDNYTVMGQGVGGSYRPYRSDFGYVFDVRATTTSVSDALSLDVGLGNTVDAGIDFINTSVNGSSGKWTSENNAVGVAQFRGSNGKVNYEPAYFKEQGEMNVDDDGMYAAMGKEKAMRFNISDQGSSVGLESSIIDESSNAINISNSNTVRQKRVKRNQFFSYLSVGEAQKFGLQKNLYAGAPKLSHIGEITTTKTDGTRYVYGLPVYNKNQKEATFNVGEITVKTLSHPEYKLDESTNLVDYTSSDNSTGNTSGTDYFFTSTSTTAYAYGYMLTAVLSADYIDRTNNGPSVDDYGTYTLFNYSSNEKVSDYEWRTPFPKPGTSSVGNFDEGAFTDDQDGKASYVYGKKDIQYLTSIETKNNIAIFAYGNREDGAGVNGENGGRDNTRLQKKLENITLYSKPDYDLMIAPSSTHQAFVIKKIHFVYDYSLCKGVYNNINNMSSTNPALNTGGKLTLKQVYFTYGNSFKGKLSTYRFNYNTTVTTNGNISTPVYSPGSVDRWGTYKPNGPNLPNSKYPYTDQVKADVDTYAALWNLKSIQLPSGGMINIECESDDYAYIQDKRAGQMFKIVGTNRKALDLQTQQFIYNYSLTSNNNLFDNNNLPGTSRNVLFFEKDPNIDISEYFQDVDKLYFRFLTKVNQQVPAGNDNLTFNQGLNGYEYVNGYADIETYGICSDNANYGYVQLKLVQGEKTGPLIASEENPISKAAWQYARLRTPRIAYNKADPSGDEEGIIRSLANSSFLQNAIQFFQGPNGKLKQASLGQEFVIGKSWVRLSNPNKKKLGGGYRVKSVRISDKWNSMLSSSAVLEPLTDGQTSVYGQEYFYDTNGDRTGTSEGVAAYEPSMGADENSFRQPIFMEEHKEQALLAPDNGLFIEAPLGESFFPAPTVGYSKVTVKSIHAGTGKTVNEYYTAKDFPTIVHSIGIDGMRKKPDPIFKLFSFSGYDRFTGSQGYSIEINDMHGKQKAMSSFEEGAVAASKSSYFHYKTNGTKLVNEVKAIKKDGKITYNQPVGIDYDMYADFRENKTTTEAIGVKADLYFFFVGPLPIPLPPILPSYHKEETELRTAVINKVIYRYGIIDRVDNYDNTNVSTTENLLWDGETGDVLLTSTTTEFKDPIYAMKYPAHWAYQAAAGAYNNTGLIVPKSIVNSSNGGEITNASYKPLLVSGDELFYTNSTPLPNSSHKVWVYKSPNNKLYFMDAIGNIITGFNSGDSDLKLVRSGARNLQTLNVGATTTFTNPIVANPAYFPVLNQNYGVLNATAIQMGDSWQTFCQCDDNMGRGDGPSYNPYLLGTKGNLRKTKEYTYLALRKQEKVNANSNIRVDGTLSKFTPFWYANSGNDWAPNASGWTFTNEATVISPYGNEHENRDALNKSSSAQFGYYQSKPVAITSNSKYKQMANENFENLSSCVDDHFGFKQFTPTTLLPSGISHTGKKSVKVLPGNFIEINKQLLNCPEVQSGDGRGD
jgi:hypothetical protein